MSEQTTMSGVRTGLFIGGEERFDRRCPEMADPGKPGVIVGEAASASAADVDDAIAAANGASRRGPHSAPQRAGRVA